MIKARSVLPGLLLLMVAAGKVFLPTGKYGPKPAPTAEAPDPLQPVVPGTFEILVFGK